MSDTFNANDPVPAIPVEIPDTPATTVTVPVVGKIEIPPESISELEVKQEKERRPVTLVAAFGIIAVTGAAVGGLVYEVVVHANQQSLTQLGTLATLGFGGLLALSGNKSDK